MKEWRTFFDQLLESDYETHLVAHLIMKNLPYCCCNFIPNVANT